MPGAKTAPIPADAKMAPSPAVKLPPNPFPPIGELRATQAENAGEMAQGAISSGMAQASNAPGAISQAAGRRAPTPGEEVRTIAKW